MDLGVSTIAYQMMIFAVLLLIGYIAAKLHVIDQKILDSLTALMLKILIPALIIAVLPSSAAGKDMLHSFSFLIVSAGLIGFFYFIGLLTGKISNLKDNTYRIHLAQTTFGNSGFIGIPLVLAVLGERGMFYMSIYYVIDQISIWTIGVQLSQKKENLKKHSWKSSLKNLATPITGSLLIAILLIITGIQLPAACNDALNGLGNACKYLSMIYLGGLFAQLDIRALLKKWSVIWIILFKMILAPIAVYFAVTALGYETAAVMVCVLVASMPSMVMMAVLAKQNDSDYEYATACIVFTTLASIATIPLSIYLINLLT